MNLPVRASTADIDAVCGYLLKKPTGATLAEAKAVVDKRHLEGRKLTALKFWGLIEDIDSKMKLTERGRRAAKDSGAAASEVLCDVVREVQPYQAMVERAAHRGEQSITGTDVAAHWHEHFRGDVSDAETILNEQVLCFFQIAEGASLGKVIVGRRGRPTRFDFDSVAIHDFVNGASGDGGEEPPLEDDSADLSNLTAETQANDEREQPTTVSTNSNNTRVFVTHGKNTKILGQVKELLEYGKFDPIVAMEHETAAKPVPKKVMDDMRTCGSAVIHVSAESVLYDESTGQKVPQINGNVLIEIGAAMALYDDRFVLLVENGVRLPSNLQGLYECRYEGEELTMPAIMKLLQAFKDF